MATASMAVAERSPNKHPRTGSEEDSVDIAALLDRAANCMDTQVDSLMERLEKRIDEKTDLKLGPVMDKLSVLEKTSTSTRSVLQVRAVLLVEHLQYLFLLTWKSRGGVDFETETHGLTEAQAWEIITKLRQGIGPVGAVRVRNSKITCYLKTPSLSSCNQIKEATNVFIEKENIKLGPQGTTPFVTEEKPAWRQEQQRTFGKALGVAEQLATVKAKYITSEWYPFYLVYVHESDSAQQIPFLTTTSGVPVATAEGAELLGITADKLFMTCGRRAL